MPTILDNPDNGADYRLSYRKSTAKRWLKSCDVLEKLVNELPEQYQYATKGFRGELEEVRSFLRTGVTPK